jgi:uncharacterized protein YuzE
MRATFYTDEDALYIKLSDSKFSYGKDLDDRRHLNFSEDDEIIGIEFLQVSDGVDLTDIPEKVKALIDPILAQRHVKVLA